MLWHLPTRRTRAFAQCLSHTYYTARIPHNLPDQIFSSHTLHSADSRTCTCNAANGLALAGTDCVCTNPNLAPQKVNGVYKCVPNCARPDDPYLYYKPDVTCACKAPAVLQTDSPGKFFCELCPASAGLARSPIPGSEKCVCTSSDPCARAALVDNGARWGCVLSPDVTPTTTNTQAGGSNAYTCVDASKVFVPSVCACVIPAPCNSNPTTEPWLGFKDPSFPTTCACNNVNFVLRFDNAGAPHCIAKCDSSLGLSPIIDPTTNLARDCQCARPSTALVGNATVLYQCQTVCPAGMKLSQDGQFCVCADTADPSFTGQYSEITGWSCAAPTISRRTQPQPAGCTLDSDCNGNKVCYKAAGSVTGTCVDAVCQQYRTEKVR